MALAPGTRVRIRDQNVDYQLEVERATNWLVALFNDRKVRERVVASPDYMAPPAFERQTTGRLNIENAHTPIAFYVLRGPIPAIRAYLGISGR